MHAVAVIAKVDRGMVGDGPRSAGWRCDAVRDWGGARHRMGATEMVMTEWGRSMACCGLRADN